MTADELRRTVWDVLDQSPAFERDAQVDAAADAIMALLAPALADARQAAIREAADAVAAGDDAWWAAQGVVVQDPRLVAARVLCDRSRLVRGYDGMFMAVREYDLRALVGESRPPLAGWQGAGS